MVQGHRFGVRGHANQFCHFASCQYSVWHRVHFSFFLFGRRWDFAQSKWPPCLLHFLSILKIIRSCDFWSQLRTTSTAASPPLFVAILEAIFLALALKSDRYLIPPGKYTFGSNTWGNKIYISLSFCMDDWVCDLTVRCFSKICVVVWWADGQQKEKV